jgi:hypothetical protein
MTIKDSIWKIAVIVLWTIVGALAGAVASVLAGLSFLEANFPIALGVILVWAGLFRFFKQPAEESMPVHQDKEQAREWLEDFLQKQQEQ